MPVLGSHLPHKSMPAKERNELCTKMGAEWLNSAGCGKPGRSSPKPELSPYLLSGYLVQSLAE
jgi:hypothetical protein